jgi:hypothetical protein
MTRFGLVLSLVAFLALAVNTGAWAQEQGTVMDLLLSVIDDTRCTDGSGRTFRDATLAAAARNDDDDAFWARHESCAGVSGRPADADFVPVPVALSARCSEAAELPGLEFEWVICGLGFTLIGKPTTPVHIELCDFFLMTHDGQKLAAYDHADLYAGQMNDMSGGISLTGVESVFGTVAFPALPGQVDGPFVIAWLGSGNFIIADELEPKSRSIL